MYNRKPRSKASKAHAGRKSIKDKVARFMDDEWSMAVKVRAGMRCEKCGSVDRIQSHHVFTRSIGVLRHYIPNGVCLCSGHHYNAHIRPHDFRDWIVSVRSQEWWDKLMAEKQKKIYK